MIRSESPAASVPVLRAGAEAVADLAVIRARFFPLRANERAEAWSTGALPLIPVMARFGVQPLAATQERAQTRLTIRPDLLDGSGQLPNGVLAMLADVATGGAIGTHLQVGQGIVTVTLTTEPVIDPLPVSGVLIATARHTARRGNLALAEGEICTEGGLRVGRMSAWYLIRTTRPAPEDPLPAPDGLHPADPAITGFGPVGALLGVTSVARSDGSATATLVGGPELMNLSMHLHGGAGALLADLTCQAALGPGFGYRTCWSNAATSSR